jgi:hypothetical protein
LHENGLGLQVEIHFSQLEIGEIGVHSTTTNT